MGLYICQNSSNCIFTHLLYFNYNSIHVCGRKKFNWRHQVKYLNIHIWISVERSGLDIYIWEAGIQTVLEVTSLDEATEGKNREEKKSMPWDIPMLKTGEKRKKTTNETKEKVAQGDQKKIRETEKWMKKCFKERGAITCQILSLNLTWLRNKVALLTGRICLWTEWLACVV